MDSDITRIGCYGRVILCGERLQLQGLAKEKGSEMSSLNQQEREWLKQAGEGIAKLGGGIDELREQTRLLAAQQLQHANKITTIEARQTMCLESHAPGNRSERNSVKIALFAVLMSSAQAVWQIVKMIS